MLLLENKKINSFSNILKIPKFVTYTVKAKDLMEMYSEFEE